MIFNKLLKKSNLKIWAIYVKKLYIVKIMNKIWLDL